MTQQDIENYTTQNVHECGYNNQFNETDVCGYCGEIIEKKIGGKRLFKDKLLKKICLINSVKAHNIAEGDVWTEFYTASILHDNFFHDLAYYGYRVVNIYSNNTHIFICNSEQQKSLHSNRAHKDLKV